MYSQWWICSRTNLRKSLITRNDGIPKTTINFESIGWFVVGTTEEKIRKIPSRFDFELTPISLNSNFPNLKSTVSEFWTTNEYSIFCAGKRKGILNETKPGIKWDWVRNLQLLFPLWLTKKMPTGGIEPPTFCLQDRRATTALCRLFRLREKCYNIWSSTEFFYRFHDWLDKR